MPQRPARLAAAAALSILLPLVACSPAEAMPAPASAAPLGALQAPAAVTAPAAAPAAPVAAASAPAAASAAATAPAARSTASTITRIARVSLESTRKAPLRSAPSGKAKILKRIPTGTLVSSTAKSKYGWYRISYAGVTGYVYPTNVRAFNPGAKKSSKYVTTQNGAKDRWFTKRTATLRSGRQSFTVPAGTPVWKLSKATRGTVKVNGGGFRNVSVNASDLVRKSPAKTSNTSKISIKAFKKLKPGSISTKYLARTNFGTQALVGAPAVKDLNALNAAFKKRFGEDLYIDLGYRSASQQRAIYRDLGPLIAAKPGTSVHEKALSFDAPEHSAYGWGSARFKWLVANAPKYGWEHPKRVRQYTSSGRLNPYREYWHFDYVGKGK